MKERCDVKLLVPLVNQTKIENEKLVTSVVEILFAYAVQDKFLPQMMTHLVSCCFTMIPQSAPWQKNVLNRLTRTTRTAVKSSYGKTSTSTETQPHSQSVSKVTQSQTPI